METFCKVIPRFFACWNYFFCCLRIFFKFFFRDYQNVKQFDSRSFETFCRARTWYNLFAKDIRRGQKRTSKGEELSLHILFSCLVLREVESSCSVPSKKTKFSAFGHKLV